jgi:NADPH-dependent 2,4-dienoyl-CoA reductase/sulfur reductase-like enzyme
MHDHDFLIVGGGMAGHAAAQAIRELEPDATLAILGEEASRPYARPPLSKGLWAGRPRESVFLPEVAGLVHHAGRRAVALDPRARVVRDARGEEYRYEDACLLATGGRPRRLPFGGDRVIYFRTLADHDRLRAVRGEEIAVVGAGFIGTELAAALASSGKKVTLVFPERLVGARFWPEPLAAHVTRVYEERGVALAAGDVVTAVEPAGDRTRVRTREGRDLLVDAVVAGLGIEPEVALARGAGLAVEDGIVVDASLRTSAPGVWAAGDVARFPCAALGGTARVEHEDAALTMGRAAGRAMAGEQVSYDHLPFFYSDLFDLGYEAVGRLDARLEVVASWRTFGREGVCWYLEDGRVRGVLLWGIFGQVDAARRMIERGVAVRPEELAAAIPG